MSMTSAASRIFRTLVRRGARRKLVRIIPVVGVAFAAAHVGRTIRAKGPVRGSADAALDLLPFVGPIKAVAELVVGDIIPPPPPPPPPPTRR